MERVIDCPVCLDTDKCFEDLQKDYNAYLCFNCGYMSDSRYETHSLKLLDELKKSPKLVNSLQFQDETRNITWFPSVINMGEKGMIYPEGTIDSWVWKYATIVDIPENERDKYQGHNKRLDLEGAKSFSAQSGFLQACKAMGITKDLST
jgi:hypothetical protein